MREWPSIVPGTPEDYYIVLNHYGVHGPAFAETDLYRADPETTISDLMSGQHSDPLRVIMFNPETNRSEDVSHAVAQEVLRRLGLEDRRCHEHWRTSSTATFVRIVSLRCGLRQFIKTLNEILDRFREIDVGQIGDFAGGSKP